MTTDDTDDTTDRMDFSLLEADYDNPYYVATQAVNQRQQLGALAQFSREEVEAAVELCEDADTDGEWAYHKGRLDMARLFMGLHLQALWTYRTYLRQQAATQTDDDDEQDDG